MARMKSKKYSRKKVNLVMDEEKLEKLRIDIAKMITENGICITSKNSVEEVVQQTNYNRLILLKKSC